MATKDTTTTTEQELAQLRQQQFESVKSGLAKALIIVCPVLLLAPPRKLNVFTLGLSSVWSASLDHQIQEYTGRSMFQHLAPIVFSTQASDGLPTEKAREIQRLLREQRESGRTNKAEQDRLQATASRGAVAMPATLVRSETGSQLEEPQQPDKRSVLQKMWMGDEKEGWKERRLQEEREKLAEGKGYWDMMIEQIWEVWSWEKQDEKNTPADDGSKEL
ncbi:hypothetical protein P152DRAFT_455857 [Eremomyces bilateralis CBS 781.70]|uniref:Uncharacterized protein n=1 Tax=Eremomyces bilateralis CBS 781.70 TaxID=1392243 RepID=A0A6G1G9R2_9PEZI|nr:uncharacterized protein P152DRAFT_455857 [Eremomyces bilateralis CBS 781.70]KAF1814818.1 hypothetical protein P152DRAFT_455857 [Eremomyces bilateralis CBS 781.70]